MGGGILDDNFCALLIFVLRTGCIIEVGRKGWYLKSI